MVAFCPFPKSPEVKVKRFRLGLLLEKISKEPGIDSVVRLLVATLMKIYNEKEQTE